MFPFPYPEARVTGILYGQLGLYSFVASLTLIITLYIYYYIFLEVILPVQKNRQQADLYDMGMLLFYQVLDILCYHHYL